MRSIIDIIADQHTKTKDKKMAMADDSMITVADIFESVELAIKNYS